MPINIKQNTRTFVNNVKVEHMDFIMEFVKEILVQLMQNVQKPHQYVINTKENAEKVVV